MPLSSSPPSQCEVPSVFQEVTVYTEPLTLYAAEPETPFGYLKEKDRAPFIIFDGNILQLSTGDGRKYIVKNKNHPNFIYTVQLFGNDYDLEIQKPPRKAAPKRKSKKGAAAVPDPTPVPITPVPKAPIVVTLSDSDESDVEILGEVIQGSRVPKRIKMDPLPANHQSVYNFEPKGRVDRRRNTIRHQASTMDPPQVQVFNVDNLSVAEAHEMDWYIRHIDNVVMDKKGQQTLWKAVSKFHIPPTDPRLTKLALYDTVEQDELIVFCSIIKRAFYTFLRRAAAVYKFLYPQVVSMQDILIQLWQSLSNHERELFYYGQPRPEPHFNADLLEIVTRFPPGIFERKILSTVYPGGVKVDPVPSYYQIFQSFIQVKVEAENRRQQEDLEALNKSSAQFYGQVLPQLVLNPH